MPVGVFEHFSSILSPCLLVSRHMVVAECILCPVGSPDPVAPIAGDRLHTAALLHNHVYVGFHDLCDLSNLATQG